MYHSIISWDCSFRNFYHLIPSLCEQKFSKDKFELIFIEQRDEETSRKYNEKIGLDSLGEVFDKYKNRFNLKVVYLGDAPHKPYSLGRCNNKGLNIARGDIVSVMDGDMVLPTNFLEELTKIHLENGTVVVNLVRKMAAYPVHVKSFKDWMKGSTSFEECLTACPDRFTPFPENCSINRGPMISARQEFWAKSNGYDESPLWDTSASTAGADVNTRLEISTGTKSIPLPNIFSVHPWHPTGFAAKRRSTDEQVKKYVSLQREVTKHSEVNGICNWHDRIDFENNFIVNFMDLINSVSSDELQQMASGPCSEELNKSLGVIKIFTKYKQFRELLISRGSSRPLQLRI